MRKFPEFIEPMLTPSSMDSYFIRAALFTAVEQAVSLFSGTLLDVGCGQMPYRDFILSHGGVTHYLGLDLDNNTLYRNSPDITWDGETIPLPGDSVDCVTATEVLEHCPKPGSTLAEIFRVLQPGGIFFFTVPFLWPLHDAPHDQYRYTPFALERLLVEAGFVQTRLRPMSGWDISLAQMLGLYLRRRPMPTLLRSLLSIIFYPVFLLLARFNQKDVAPVNDKSIEEIFSQSVMPVGISGIAYKPVVA